MYERFTDRACKIVDLAYREAAKMEQEYVGTEHLLLALIFERYGVAGHALRNLALTYTALRSEILEMAPPGLGLLPHENLSPTPRFEEVCGNAETEARSLRHNYVGTEHLLLAIAHFPESLGAAAIVRCGVRLEDVREEVLSILGHDINEIPRAEPEVPTTAAAAEHSILRILDAAANRATEGLRVVEDYCRFALDDRYLTTLVKELRHHLADALAALPRADRHALRETQQDVGTTISTVSEQFRRDATSVCEASCERVKQSLRSLEEFSKVTNPDAAAKFESLRYRFYTLEKALTNRLRFSGELENAKLCVLIDGSITEDQVLALITAGVGMIQLREKNLNDRELLDRAHHLRLLCHSPTAEAEGCLLIINDRPDIAAAAGADGVHLGQDDLPVKEARKILGPRKIIGVSTHNIEHARQAVLDGANYIGVGPTFPSTTKQFDAFPGTALLKQVAEEISLPAFAIGGITLENLDEVLATGIKRVAVSGAIAKAHEPGEVAGKFSSRL